MATLRTAAANVRGGFSDKTKPHKQKVQSAYPDT